MGSEMCIRDRSGDDVVIEDGDWVAIQWNSMNADSCSGTGPGLLVNSVNGLDYTITEPVGGASSTYSISCTGPGGMAVDSLTISKVSLPVATLEIRINGGSWGTDDITIGGSDEVGLRWNGENADSCSGQGFFTGNSVSGINDTVTEPEPGMTADYVLSCDGRW